MAAAPRRPLVVAFDVNETLFNLDNLGDRFEEIGLPGAALDLWFARTLQDGFAMSALRDAPTFVELGKVHLQRILNSFGLGEDEVDLDEVIGTFRDLDAHEDVRPALERLRDNDVRAVTLTNGSADVTRALLERNGLTDLVAGTYDVQMAGQWKPHAEPYHMVAREYGVEPAEVALVAVHSWDVHGAKRAGLTTAWVSRLEGEFVTPMDEPHVRASTLTGAVKALLDL